MKKMIQATAMLLVCILCFAACASGSKTSLYDKSGVLKQALKTPSTIIIDNTNNNSTNNPSSGENSSDNDTVVLKVPSFPGEKKFFTAGEGNYTISATADLKGYQAYIEQLLADGFRQYTTNQIGDNLFGTYIKDSTTPQTVVYTMFYPATQNFRMTYGPLGFLPDVAKVPAPATGAVQPSITQIGRKGALQSAPGMSYVIQLADASFILIDGGSFDSSDEADLYKFLCDHTPQGQKPVISAWFISHAHGDHMGLVNQFLSTYGSSKIELRMVAYNFPDFESISIKNESAAGMASLVKNFKETVASKHPNAKHFVFHTGQKLYLSGCEVEIFYTPEDYYGKAGETSSVYDFPWGNHTCVAARFTINQTSFMWVGDCEVSLNKQMADTYGEALKSDIFQPSHHGFNGGQLDFYKYVNPDICLWAVDQSRFETQIPTYSFNKWLLDDSIKQRKHYTASETITIPC